MPHLFDATMKDFVALETPDYGLYFQAPANRPLSLLNVDLSTISAATDAAIRVGDPVEEIIDLNFQSGPDSQLPSRIYLYNSVLHYKYQVPVRTIVILLRPAADHANLTGVLSYQSGKTKVEFEYEVIRIWERPAEVFLNDGLGIAPLAVLGALPDDQSESDAIPTIVERIKARMKAETTEEHAAKLLQCAFNLAKMRIPVPELEAIFQGVVDMKAAYDELLEEGAIKSSHKTLLRQGRLRCGPPAIETEVAIRGITDIERLDRMLDAVLVAKDWQDLLDTK